MDPLTLALTVGGGLLSAGGSIADRLRARRESRRAIADLEPYTDHYKALLKVVAYLKR